MKNLLETQVNEKVIIEKIEGDTRFISRITSMGITIGSEILILSNDKRTPLLVFARDTMIALNREDCKKLEVKQGNSK